MHQIADGREDLYALAHCTQLCDRLIEGGVQDLHFYTLNRPHLTRDVVRAIARSDPRVRLIEPSANGGPAAARNHALAAARGRWACRINWAVSKWANSPT